MAYSCNNLIENPHCSCKLIAICLPLQGATIGRMVSVPILDSLEPMMREQVAECTGVGESTEEWPNGEWLDCNELTVGRARWALAGINYFFIGLGMQLGTKHQRLTGCLSGAMVGGGFL